MSTGLEGLHDTVSLANRTSLERERGRKREREIERAQRDRHARSTRRFFRSHYEITVCDRISMVVLVLIALSRGQRPEAPVLSGGSANLLCIAGIGLASENFLGEI